jgi:hypothetical protein
MVVAYFSHLRLTGSRDLKLAGLSAYTKPVGQIIGRQKNWFY